MTGRETGRTCSATNVRVGVAKGSPKVPGTREREKIAITASSKIENI